MSFSFADFSSTLETGGAISPDDVLAIRRAVWPDGAVARAEAETIFDLHRRARRPGPEWGDFFIEAITDHVVNGAEPRGYVDDETAAWLTAEIARGGPVGPVELELVVGILEKAVNVPASLKAWALAEVERCVLHGTGATRRDGDVRPGIVDEAEVRLMRRIVFAGGGDGALVVSREEAQMLWRIKDATLGAANAEGWKQLFVQAVGNHLMAWSSYRPLEREEAARLETFMDDHRSGVLGFLSRMRGSPDFEGARKMFEGGETADQHRAAVDSAAAVTAIEKAWLEAEVDRDGRRDECEEALLRFLEQESGPTLP
ncbi:MAG TPA: hypothetical protein VEA60_14505 [Allosphingosinicella sp.]|nr:hypothetical protein [Allosphingosinicella sp.]